MRPNKTLGQHFLRARSIAREIVDAASVTTSDVVLEVGPGKGILTELLLTRARRVIAVEKDSALIPSLSKKFAHEISSGKLDIREGDIITHFETLPLPSSYKVVANIPYYITGVFLRMIFARKHQPKTVALMLQREVARRIVEGGSLLSLAVQAYGNVRYIRGVPRKFFSPPPRVDSAIVVIEQITRKRFQTLPEQWFFAVARSGFAQRRKKLIRNLEPLARREALERAFALLQMPENIRAEELAVSGWFSLAHTLAKLGGIHSYPHK